MDLKIENIELPDGGEHPQIKVAAISDWALFESIAEYLEKALEGVWVERLDDIDDRWWDLETPLGKLTFHLQHYLGMSLYPATLDQCNSEDTALLELALQKLREYDSA